MSHMNASCLLDVAHAGECVHVVEFVMSHDTLE